MDSRHVRQVCLSLTRADSEDEVASLLRDAGHWDDPAEWRFYGERETNFNTIGTKRMATSRRTSFAAGRSGSFQPSPAGRGGTTKWWVRARAGRSRAKFPS
jgi:hypothetical protein